MHSETALVLGPHHGVWNLTRRARDKRLLINLAPITTGHPDEHTMIPRQPVPLARYREYSGKLKLLPAPPRQPEKYVFNDTCDSRYRRKNMARTAVMVVFPLPFFLKTRVLAYSFAAAGLPSARKTFGSSAVPSSARLHTPGFLLRGGE